MAKAGAKKKAANGYKLAEVIPAGEILEDLRKNKWRLGESIGQGGFGRIYCAQDVNSSSTSYPYVIKIEPHANGPLFVEMQFYLRHAKPEDVNTFKQEKKLKTFGMPLYLGSGSHEFNNEKYRFIVTELYGTDLWKVFLENNEVFPASTVFKIGIQILDVLEYIHGRGYVHADIKGANILIGITKETKNKQVYLVDFGLATRYTSEKVFKPDPKKAHDGTIEYLSRDAHKGVQTRRGDLEILALNLIQWLGCKLPWMHLLKVPKDVQECKEKDMRNIPKFIQSCFGKKSPPGPIVDYLNYLATLEFDSKPDYAYIRKIFLSGIEKSDSLDKPLKFSPALKTPVKRKSETKSTPTPKKRAAKSKAIKDILPSEDENENGLDKNGKTEIILPPRRGTTRNQINYKEDSDDEHEKIRKKRVVKKKNTPTGQLNVTGDNLEDYTDASKEGFKKKQKINKKVTKLHTDDDMKGYNAEMKEIAAKKKTSRKTRTKATGSSNKRKNGAQVAVEENSNEDSDFSN